MTKKGQKQKSEQKELVEKDTKASADAFDEEVNSGFGSYLRSSTGKKRFEIEMFALNIEIFSGQELLRMFVVVNSLVMFLTIAWPQMKIAFETITDYYNEHFGSAELF
jgi:hypothetical protein